MPDRMGLYERDPLPMLGVFRVGRIRRRHPAQLLNEDAFMVGRLSLPATSPRVDDMGRLIEPDATKNPAVRGVIEFPDRVRDSLRCKRWEFVQVREDAAVVAGFHKLGRAQHPQKVQITASAGIGQRDPD